MGKEPGKCTKKRGGRECDLHHHHHHHHHQTWTCLRQEKIRNGKSHQCCTMPPPWLVGNWRDAYCSSWFQYRNSLCPEQCKGPKWLPFLVGLPPLLMLYAASAALGSYALPKFTQLTVTSHYAASSASHYGISVLTRHIEDDHVSKI